MSNKTRQIQVTIVNVAGETALVEWVGSGTPYRVYVPLSDIDNGSVAGDLLVAGVPYGVDWESVKLEADSQLLAANLRKNGIWTYSDLLHNPKTAIACLQATYAVDLAKLMQYATTEVKRNE